MVDLDKIKARLGSISPAKMNEFPISVKKLLEEDFPEVIRTLDERDQYIRHLKTRIMGELGK